MGVNQDDYIATYDAAVTKYEATKAEREKVAAEIRQRSIRKREFERFITELEKLPEAVSEFDETLWGSLVEYAHASDIRGMDESDGELIIAVLPVEIAFQLFLLLMLL